MWFSWGGFFYILFRMSETSGNFPTADTDPAEVSGSTPRLVFKPDIISKVVVIHADATDPRVETFVRGEDNEFRVESVDR